MEREIDKEERERERERVIEAKKHSEWKYLTKPTSL